MSDDITPNPIEAILRLQHSLKTEIENAERDIKNLQSSTLHEITKLQTRCVKLRGILDVLGNHAEKSPTEPLPSDVWNGITST